ncbi:MAG: helix-turn-helix domain-containing protein [Rickettsiales bacterium]
MQQNASDLTPEQAQAIELLLSGHTPCRIAQSMGLHRATIYRWRQLATLQALEHQLEQRRRDELRSKWVK